MTHPNAPLTPTGRLRLARVIVEDGWPLRRAAERFQVSTTTAQRWADRYRLHGPAGMAARLGLNPATVHRVLVRYRMPRLDQLDRATGVIVRRYERAQPGELVHVDIKKLGRIPDGGGHRIWAASKATRTSGPPPASAATASQ